MERPPDISRQPPVPGTLSTRGKRSARCCPLRHARIHARTLDPPWTFGQPRNAHASVHLPHHLLDPALHRGARESVGPGHLLVGRTAQPGVPRAFIAWLVLDVTPAAALPMLQSSAGMIQQKARLGQRQTHAVVQRHWAARLTGLDTRIVPTNHQRPVSPMQLVVEAATDLTSCRDSSVQPASIGDLVDLPGRLECPQLSVGEHGRCHGLR